MLRNGHAAAPAQVRTFYLRVVRAHRGGCFTTEGEDIGFASKASALEQAEQMQKAFDDDCDPCRAYVIDADGVAVAAAGRVRRGRMFDN